MFALKFCKMYPSILAGIRCKTLSNFPHEMLIVKNHRHFTIYKSSVLDKKVLFPSFFQMYRFMAGHAKWQNVKNIKAEKDRQKSLMCNKYIRKVFAAVREKGPDPKTNIKLASILDSARKDNVPLSTLEGALKKSSSKKFEAGIVELLGPGGCFVIFEYGTDCVSEMRRTLKQLCKKYSVGIFPGGGGRWRSSYEQKGIIKVTNLLNGQQFDAEKMLDFAIEAGAEDVQKSESDDHTFYEFFCAPEDINLVKKELEKTFSIDEAFVAYLPITTVKLSDDDKTIAMDFLNELSDLPDTSRVYENIE